MTSIKHSTSDGAQPARLFIQMIGGFDIRDDLGNSFRPKSKRSCAVIALLALSENFELSRSFLRRTLWSDRSMRQSSGSLRQCVYELKKSLRLCDGLLSVSKNTLTLDPGKFTCDLLKLIDEDADSSTSTSAQSFLQDIWIEDPAFQAWHRAIQERIRGARADQPTQSNDNRRPRVLSVVEHDGGQAVEMISARVSDLITNGIADWANAEVRESALVSARAEATASDLILSTRATSSNAGAALRISLYHAGSNRRLWTTTTDIQSRDFDTQISPRLIRSANQSVDRALADFQVPNNALNVVDSIQTLFTDRHHNAADIKDQFLTQHEAFSDPVLLAWAAYAMTYEVGERRTTNSKAVTEEAAELCKRALGASCGNSMVLALSSHVHSFLLSDFFTGYDLACRSIRCNPGNPLAWAFRSLANLGLGRGTQCYEDAMWALAIAGEGPHSSLLTGVGCAAAAISGNGEQAIMLGETNMRLHPDYSAPLRFLYALYNKLDDPENAQRILLQIQSNEPDFEHSILKDEMYPIPALRESGLFDFDKPRMI